MATQHEDAIKAIANLREALEQMPTGDVQFATLGEYHKQRIKNIEGDVLEHEERNP